MTTDSSNHHATGSADSAPGETQPVINFWGEKIALGPFERSHVPLENRWNNDFQVIVLAGDPLRPKSQAAAEAEYEQWTKDAHNEPGFMIYEREPLRPIGVTGLRHIDSARRCGEFGIAIGEKDAWGKGYGTEATIRMLDYGFNVLGLHSIMLTTYSYNERAIRAYQRAGFREFGRWREAMRLNGQYYDIVHMDILESDFHNPYPPMIQVAL